MAFGVFEFVHDVTNNDSEICRISFAHFIVQALGSLKMVIICQ